MSYAQPTAHHTARHTPSNLLLGALLMLGCSVLLGDEAMHAWGWRLPFLIAAPLGLIGFYLRARMEDAPVFLELQQSAEKKQYASVSLKELLTGFWRPLLLLGGLVVALNVVNYVLLAYMPTFMQKQLGMSENMSLLVPLIGMLALIFVTETTGYSLRGRGIPGKVQK